MKHVLIINGNPDPSAARLSSALAAAYCKGAEDAGHSVQQIAVAKIAFPVLRHAEDFTTAPDEAILSAQDQFLRADHVVFIFPLWLGAPPALLKAFMEQLARDQFLLKENTHGFPRGGLKGRSASVIVTMGMPATLYRVWFGAHGIKGFTCSILGMAGFRPVRTHYFGGRSATARGAPRLIEQVHRLGRSLA